MYLGFKKPADRCSWKLPGCKIRTRIKGKWENTENQALAGVIGWHICSHTGEKSVRAGDWKEDDEIGEKTPNFAKKSPVGIDRALGFWLPEQDLNL